MPAAAATLGPAIIRQIIIWTISYILDPRGGNGQNLPSEKELQSQFPNIEVTVKDLEYWLTNELGSKNLQEAIKDRQKLHYALERLEEPQEKESTVPVEKPSAPLQSPKAIGEKVSALGVLAELEAIEPQLRKHNQQAAADISTSLNPQVKSLISSLKIKGLSKDQIDEISQKISQEVATETLQKMPGVVDLTQTPEIIEESLINTLKADPALNPKVVTIDPQKLTRKVSPLASQIASTHQAELETAAVYGTLAQIPELKKPGPELEALIEKQVTTLLTNKHSLATPAEKAALVNGLKQYLPAYAGHVESKVTPNLKEGTPISFDDLLKHQNSAHNHASQVFEEALSKSLGAQNARILKNQINTGDLPDELATTFKLKPISAENIETLGLGRAQPNPKTFTGIAGFALASSKSLQIPVYLATLAHNLPRLETTVAGLEAKIAQFETQIASQKSLNYSQRKQYELLLNQLEPFKAARALRLGEPQKFQSYLTFLKESLPSSTSLSQASTIAWNTTEAHLGLGQFRFYVPRYRFTQVYSYQTATPSRFRSFVPRLRLPSSFIAKHPPTFITRFLPPIPGNLPAYSPTVRLLAQRTMGSLAYGLGNYRLGFKTPAIGSLSFVSKGAGMGKAILSKASAGLMAIGLAGSILKPVLKYGGGLLLGLGLYFLGLAKAAFMGFLIGAGIGGTAGAVAGGIIGFHIGVALAPFTFGLSIPVFTAVGATVGFFAGAGIGGIAGGLIGYGLSSGTTTAVTTGIGTGVGATSGAIVGGILGSAFGPIGTFLGAAAGAYIGATIGAGIGYLAGQLIGVIGLPATGAIAGAVFGFFLGGGPLGIALNAAIGWIAAGGWTQIKNFFSALSSGTATTASGIFGAIGGFFSSIGSALGSALGAAAGATLGFLSGAGNFLLGLGSTTVSAATALVPVAAGVASIGTLTIFGGTIITAVSLSSIETDSQPFETGENELFTISKTADPTKIENSQLPKKIAFTITLTAKTSLTNISASDELSLQRQNNTIDLDGNSKLLSCSDPMPTNLNQDQSWTCQFSIQATQNPTDYRDSTVRNNITVTASSNGNSATGNATAFVIIGSPPSECPTGWPTAHGRFTQGPRGSTSHARLANLFGEESIDIGDNFNHEETFATFNGTVFYANGTDSHGGGYGYHVDIEGICNGQPFRARYAHLHSVDSQMTAGNPVTVGQRIGRIGSTGEVIGAHLHYSFFGGLEMKTPYIPQTPNPSDCEDGATPCNISW